MRALHHSGADAAAASGHPSAGGKRVQVESESVVLTVLEMESRKTENLDENRKRCANVRGRLFKLRARIVIACTHHDCMRAK